jgi:hypothetical protein
VFFIYIYVQYLQHRDLIAKRGITAQERCTAQLTPNNRLDDHSEHSQITSVSHKGKIGTGLSRRQNRESTRLRIIGGPALAGIAEALALKTRRIELN